MARCTVLVYEHWTTSTAAACPACGGRSIGFRSYSSSSRSPSRSNGRRGRSCSDNCGRPCWSRLNLSVEYRHIDIRTLTPVREIDKRTAKSRVGLLMVSPALLRRLQGAWQTKSFQHYSRATSLLCTTRRMKPSAGSVGSTSGLNTADDTLEKIAANSPG